MNRREILQRAAMVVGYAITGPAMAGILNGCKAVPEQTFKPEFLSQEQGDLIATLSEIIIPRTDTPGAIDAGVPMFIDRMLMEVYPKESQDAFVANLNAFNDGSNETYGKSFMKLDESEKIEYFKKHHDESIRNTTIHSSSGFWNAATKSSKPFILEVKELTILGFFTSKEGATQVLQYKQVPGPYKGCVPLAEVGKTWAT